MLVKRRRAGRVGRLHAAQVVLVRDALGVERVLAVAVAVPQVDRRARHGGVAVAGVGDREVDGERDALGLGRRGAEAAADVGAHDAGVVEHVGAVGPVARVGTAGLVGHLGLRGGRRPLDEVVD